MKFRITFTVFTTLSLNYLALAASNSPSFNYQGRILNAQGTGGYGDVVDFTLEVYDPSGTCLLYQEKQSGVDLTDTDGLFSLQVGSAVSDNVKRQADDPHLSIDKVFSNSGTELRAAGTNCATGYTPASSDFRKLRVKITAHTTGDTTTLTPDLQIHSVPFATTAESLQGLTPSQFIQDNQSTSGHVTQSNLESLTSGSDVGSTLHHHDSLYVKAGSSSNSSFSMAAGSYLGLGDRSTLGLGHFTGAEQTSLTAGLTSTDKGKIWLNNSDNEIYYWDGGAARKLAVTGAPLSSTLQVTPAANASGIIVQGSNLQSEDLTQWKNNSGSVLASMDPTGKLTVANIRITGGSPGASKILTSDASGNATWETPAAGPGGTLTAVTGTSPISSSGGTTPVISIPKSDATHDGYLAQADFTTFNNKQSAIPTGSTSQYFRGDKSWSSLSTDVFALMTATSPITVSTVAGTIGINGLSGLGTADQILAMNHSAGGVEYKTLTGTSNQITVTGAAGSLTLSTPQDIATSSSPSFTGLTLSGLNSAGVVRTNSSGVLSTSALSNSDITTAIGYTPVNKAGDTLSGGLNVSSGNVGIGTTTPSTKLEVVGSVTATSFVGSGAAFTGNVTMPSAGNVIMPSTGIWKSDGNVGIGTTNPTAKLDVSGNMHLKNSASWTISQIEQPSTSLPALLQFVPPTIDSSTPTWEIGTRADLSSLPGLTFGRYTGSHQTPDMYISPGGKVGIGTTNPIGRLDILSGADNSGANDLGVAFQWNGGGYRHWIRTRHNNGAAGNSLDFFLNSSNTVAGSSAPTVGTVHNLTLLDGKVGIGTTSPQYPLHVVSPFLGCSGASSNNQYAWSGAYGAPEWTTIRATGAGNANQCRTYSIVASQEIAAVGYVATSDQRLKEEVKSIPGDKATELIKKMRPVHFKWKATKYGNFGFIAQDLARLGLDDIVVPVPDTEDALLEETVDPDGFVSPKGAKLTVSYNQIVAIITSSIQNIISRIETLFIDLSHLKEKSLAKDKEINALKEENAAIKARLEKLEKMMQSKK